MLVDVVFKVLNVGDDSNLWVSPDGLIRQRCHEEPLAVDGAAASEVVERGATHWGLLNVMVQPRKVAGLLQGAA